MARCLRLPPAQREALEEAALGAADCARLLETRALDRLLNDAIGPHWEYLVCGSPPCSTRTAPPPQPPRRSTPGPAVGEGVRLRLDILEIAACFAQRVEFLPYELLTTEQVLDELHCVAQELAINPAVVAALGSLQRVRLEQLVERVYRLPVFPLVALRALDLARSEDSSVSAIEKLVCSDQVLAGRLIQTANSSLYSPARRISSLRQAISYIGLEAARRLLIAAVFHPLFASAGLKGLWRHSLEVSQLAEFLARECRRVPPEEAFLAGLVHDVGRLALQTAQGEDVIAYTRMLEQGCEPVFAEMVLCGFDHGRAGAEVLRFWSFPEHLAQAVADHHHPEHSDSDLAAIIYLAEFWTGSEEDLPSGSRVRGALKRAGLDWESLAGARLRPGGLADLLASVA